MVLARQHLQKLAFGKNPMIKSSHTITEDQVQIASFDCKLGDRVYKMKSAALPQEEKVSDLIAAYQLFDFALDDKEGGYLEKEKPYIIPLREHLELSPEYWAEFSPKSSTGRCDVFVRVLSDKHPHYDQTPPGYRGPLYAEIIPLSSDVIVKSGLALTQFRVRSNTRRAVTSEELAMLHAQYGIMRDNSGHVVANDKLLMKNGSLYFHINLDREVVGFEALTTILDYLDMSKIDEYDPALFWRPIPRPKNRQIVLAKNAFYLLATRERTVIPPELCGQMLPYEISSGELRPHYAGFFDNGFGGEHGTTGVLEVRARDVPFRLVHGQPICRMDFERTLEVPDRLYSGNYVGSGPSLSKHFRNRYEVWKE